MTNSNVLPLLKTLTGTMTNKCVISSEHAGDVYCTAELKQQRELNKHFRACSDSALTQRLVLLTFTLVTVKQFGLISLFHKKNLENLGELVFLSSLNRKKFRANQKIRSLSVRICRPVIELESWKRHQNKIFLWMG